MNRVRRTIFCWWFAAGLAVATVGSAQQSDPFADSLSFRNGDFLYGRLMGIDNQGAVHWKHPDSGGAIDFEPGAISQIDFPTRTNTAPRAENTCRLLLNDGSSLEGDLVSCDRSELVLQTWYAGRLNIAREALRSLIFLPRSPAVVDGITGLDGWTQGSTASNIPGETGKWIYRNGAFYADKAASIARDVKLPDVAEIQFDLAWKGGLNLAIALYTDSLLPILLTAKDQGPNFGGFYSLRFQYSAFIDLWPIKKSEPVRQLGQLYIPALNTSDRLHVDLRISKPQARIALLLDGKPVKEWIDPQGFAGEGTGVRFVQNPPGIIKLSNLRITKWDGNFSQTTDEADDTAHDAFWPENGTRVSGTIDYIADGKMHANTGKGPVEFPLAMLNAIDFAQHPGHQSQVEGNTVRATFAQGGNLTFVLESWKPDKMIVRSPDFGKARMDPAAFTRLQFLAPEKKPAEGPKG